MFSTHVLSDVERICDRIAVLEQGRLVLSGTLTEIQRQHQRNGFSIRFATVEEAIKFMAADELKNTGIEISRDDKALTIMIGDNSGGQQLIDLLSQMQIAPEKFEAMEPTR